MHAERRPKHRATLERAGQALPPIGVIVSQYPIGFLSDHIEVLYDLDVEAAAHQLRRRDTGRRLAIGREHPLREQLLDRTHARPLRVAQALAGIPEPGLRQRSSRAGHVVRLGFRPPVEPQAVRRKRAGGGLGVTAVRESRPAYGHFRVRAESGMLEVEAGALPLSGPAGYHGAIIVFWPLPPAPGE